MKRKIIVGVWKDKLLPGESINNASELNRIYSERKLSFDACVAPSPISIYNVYNATKEAGAIKVVSQDVHWPDPKRSFIGTTSIAMLKEIGIDMCMIGHSERRRFFNESNEDTYKKLKACIEAGIFPILGVGDDAAEYPERKIILADQIRGALCPENCPAIDISKIAVAYEPVWATSTWRSAQELPTGKEVKENMNLMADILTSICKFDISLTPLLYGGSVSPANAEDYFSQEIVDGALVGGASLKVESLSKIFDIGQKIWFGK